MAYKPEDYLRDKAAKEARQAAERARREAERQTNIDKAIKAQRGRGNESFAQELETLKPTPTSSSSSTTPAQAVFTGQDQNKPQSFNIPSSSRVETIRDSQGRVVGINDPVQGKSYAVNPTAESNVFSAEQSRAQAIYASQPVQPRQNVITQNRQAETFTQGGRIGAYKPSSKQLDAQTAAALAQIEKENRQPAVVKAFKQGLTATPEQVYSGNVFDTPKSDIEQYGQIVGGFTGLYANTAIKAVSATTGIKLAGAGFKAIAPLTAAASKSAFTSIPLNVAGATATGYGAFLGAMTVEETKQRAVAGLPLIPSKQENEIFNIARKAEKSSQQGILNQVGFEIGITGNRNVFRQAATAEAQRRGISDIQNTIIGVEAKRAGVREGTLTGTLAAGAFSEQSGQVATKTALAARAKPTFGTFFNTIAPAGVGEGYAQSFLSRQNIGDRRDYFKGWQDQAIGIPLSGEVKKKYEGTPTEIKFKTTPFIEDIAGSAFGGLSAGILGGAIASTATKGQKTKSFALETLGNVLDPTEKPSDFLQDIIVGGEKNVRLVRGSSVPVNIFSNTPTNTFTTSPATVGTFAATPMQSGKKGFAATFVDINSFIGSISPTPTPVTVPANEGNIALRSNAFSFVPVDSFVPTDTKTPTETPSPSNTPTPTNVPTDITAPTNTPTDTFTNTFTNIFNTIPTNVPVVTPMFRVPPPMPLALPFGAGNAYGNSRKARVGYIDELTASTNIFKQGLNGALFPKDQRAYDKKVAAQEKAYKKNLKATRAAGKSARIQKTTSKGQGGRSPPDILNGNVASFIFG